MHERTDDIAARFRSAEVGDTIRIRIDKSMLNAEVRDRVSPVLGPAAEPNGHQSFEGVAKDAAGVWDLESATSAKNGSIVEIVVRRAASDL